MLRDALRLACAELDAERFSSHSGKRGIATELANHDADIRQIMRVAGHKSANSALGYIEEVQRWDKTPLRLLDL